MNTPYEIQRSLWKIADWVYPPTCASCGLLGYRFCPECLSKVNPINFDYCIYCGDKKIENQNLCGNCENQKFAYKDSASWAEYEGSIREAIHDLKYHNNLGLGDFFSPYLIQLIEKKNWHFDLVVPVPLSKGRMKQRGFNQAALVAKPISRYFRVPFSGSALIRTKETPSQIDLSAHERITNLRDAFFGNTAKLKGKKVVIVDDIITTGSTMKYCSQSLLDSGASEVYAISIARAFKRN